MTLPDTPLTPHWRKASRSSASGSDCVEVASIHGAVAVRDSKHPDGPLMAVHAQEWAAFVHSIKAGIHDL